MTQQSIYYLLDGAAIIATAIMLYLTEKPMPEKPKTPTMEQRVYAMLDSAVENGYDIRDWSVDDIVADLLAFADLTNDDDTEENIRPHVITWKISRSVPT